MPPKKVKGAKADGGKSPKSKKGKGKKSPKPVAPTEPLFVLSDESLGEKEFDYLLDLNDEFFSNSNRIIQNLMEANRIYEASKIKKYVDIIFNLHRKYADEVAVTSELRPQIERAEAKLRLALEMTATSEQAMDRLKESLADAWRESDASFLREQDTQEKMQEIVLKCEKYEMKEAEKQDDTADFGNLAKYKNIILRERDRLNGEVLDLTKRLQLQRFYCESLEYLNKNHEDSIQKLSARTKSVEAEKQTLSLKIVHLTSNLNEQRELNVKTNIKLDITSKELIEVQQKLQTKIYDFDRQKVIIDKLRQNNGVNLRIITKYEEEIADFRKDQKNNEDTIRALRLEDKVKGNTIDQNQKKIKKVMQDLSAITSKLYQLNRTNHQMNSELLRSKNQINALEKDILSAGYKYDELRRLKDNYVRERDNSRSDIIKLNDTIADLRHTIMIQSNTIDSLRLDVNKLNVKLDEAKIITSKAEKERDEMSQEVESLQERLETLQEQIQLKTAQITDLTDKLQQKHFALINIKKQLETVHSEKMILQRSLDSCTQERDNFRVLQMKTNHQITQLTHEIFGNQNKINSLNLRIERLNNDKKDLQSELKNKENILAGVRKDLKEIKNKNENLMKTIADDEFRFMKISQDLEETRKEKNLIGLQMVRRNDEIVLLKEKLIIMQTALDKGQTQYNQRVEDIRLLKVEICNLQTERECLSRAIKATADMREEIIRLQRMLNQERIKVRTLTEDAKTPTGVHRWRILKGEDPSKYQLLCKLQALQKRNIAQEVEKTNLQQKLVNSNKVYENLRRYVQNLPAGDVRQKLAKTKRINQRQIKKLKSLSAELAINEIELKARECIIDEFKTTLKVTKQKMICGIKGLANEPSEYEVNEQNLSADSYIEDTSNQDTTATGNYIECIFQDSDDKTDPQLHLGCPPSTELNIKDIGEGRNIKEN